MDPAENPVHQCHGCQTCLSDLVDLDEIEYDLGYDLTTSPDPDDDPGPDLVAAW